jgi:ribosomal protein L37AE/L43A
LRDRSEKTAPNCHWDFVKGKKKRCHLCMTIRIMKPLTGIWDNCRFCATIISMSIAKPSRQAKESLHSSHSWDTEQMFSNFFEKRRRRTYLNLQAMYVRCTSKMSLQLVRYVHMYRKGSLLETFL